MPRKFFTVQYDQDPGSINQSWGEHQWHLNLTYQARIGWSSQSLNLSQASLSTKTLSKQKRENAVYQLTVLESHKEMIGDAKWSYFPEERREEGRQGLCWEAGFEISMCILCPKDVHLSPRCLMKIHIIGKKIPKSSRGKWLNIINWQVMEEKIKRANLWMWKW